MTQLAVLGAMMLLCGRAVAGVACLQSDTELAGRKVNDVQIVTPLEFPSPALNRLFFSTLDDRLARLKPVLAIQKGQKFSEADYNTGRLQIDGAVVAAQRESPQRVQLAVVLPALEDCDASGLTVVYRIYSTDVILTAISVVDINQTKITQSLTPAVAGLRGSHVISPTIGYNASRGVFGGSTLTTRMDGGIFQVFRMSSTVTTGTGVGDASLVGGRDFDRAFLNRGEWRVDYHYSNYAISHSPTQLRAGTLGAQFLGSTKVSNRGSVAGRYGIAVEGGNRQTNLTASDVLGSVASAPYGALKGYAGVSFGIGRDTGSASYGIQVGKSPNKVEVGYIKHVVDVNVKQRFLPRPHSPIEFDSAFNAGWIQSASNEIPATERFYGGNVAREFVSGDSWKIQDGPLLRSFPQYAFNAVPGGPFGATRFFSANFTFAPTVNHYPAVPDDVLLDPILRSALGFQLRTVRDISVYDCEARTSVFTAVVRSLQPLNAVVKDIQSWDARLNAAPLPQPVKDALSDVDDSLSDLTDALNTIASSPRSGSAVTSVRNILNANNSPALLLAKAGNALADTLPGTSEAHEETVIRDTTSKLRDALKPVSETYAKVDALNTPAPSKYGPVLDQLPGLMSAIEALQPSLETLKDHKDDAIAESRDAVQSYADDSIRKIKEAMAQREDAYNKLDSLLKDWGAVAPASPKSVLDAIVALQQALRESHASPRLLDAPAMQIKVALNEVLATWRPIDRPPMQSCALADAAFAFRAADAAFRELNLYQVSPVAIFDFARMSTPHMGSTGFRYAAGPGVRLSLATLNLTLGYAFNVNKRAGEGRGAFFVSLDVSDLFR